jgi:hypothetical protein
VHTEVPVSRVAERCSGVRYLREEAEVSMFVYERGVYSSEGPVRYPQEFSRVMERARVRCSDLGKSEKVLGYMDSYQAYSDMAEELRGLPAWLFQEITRANASGSLRRSSAA